MTTNDATPREALVEKYNFECKAYSARRALEDAVEDAMKRMFPSDEGDYVVTVHKVADRAVPEPDADAVEAAAKAIHEFRYQNGDEPRSWDGILKAEMKYHVDHGSDWYRQLARAALQAAAVPTMQAAAGDDLDAMLNNIHPNTTASLQFIQPYLTTDPEPYWQAHVSVPTGGLTGFQKHRGTGATRMAAIQDAVRHATGAEGERE